jgi:Arc/MetJ-type ribon-helix-helix transcriptional regulator
MPAAPNPIRQAITLLEQELEPIEQRRGELLEGIAVLRRLVGDETAAKKKTNERTNERTSKARARSAGATEPP